MLQSWIITLYQTRSIFPHFPTVCESGWNQWATRTIATIYTTLKWTGLKPRYTTSKFLYIIRKFVFLRKPIELILVGGKYIFRINANFSRVFPPFSHSLRIWLETVGYQNHCYNLYNTKMNWFEAQIYYLQVFIHYT